MTAHFLHYSAVASNLTPKLTEPEIVEIISGHYPAYVQRTLLSAGVKTIRDVLNLLNRLESLGRIWMYIADDSSKVKGVKAVFIRISSEVNIQCDQ
jgi:hypothetical protein